MSGLRVAGFGTPGFVKDTAEYVSVPEAFNEVQNARFNTLGAVAFGGHAPALSPAPYNPLWLRSFPPVGNPIWVYANLAKVGAFDGTGHVDLTRISSPYGAIIEERWAGDTFNGVGILNNTQDVPQAWLDFDVSEKLIDLPNWPASIQCKFIRPFKQFLIAGNITDTGINQPFRLRWSHPADPGTIPASWALNDPTRDSGQFDIAETDDELVDGMTLGDSFIAYKQKTAYVVQYVGGNDIFGYRQIHASRGVLCRDCIQPFTGGHFVFGLDDIYVHNGQRGSDQSVVDAQLRNWIFNQIDASNFFYCYTVKYQRENEIWACFPEAGETYPTIAVVYNTVTKGIGIRRIPRVPFMYPGASPKVSAGGDIWGGEDTAGLEGVVQAGAAGVTGVLAVTSSALEFRFGTELYIDAGSFVGYVNGAHGSLVSNTTGYTITAVYATAGYGDLSIVSADLYAAVQADPTAFSFRVLGHDDPVDVTFSGSDVTFESGNRMERIGGGLLVEDREYSVIITYTP